MADGRMLKKKISLDAAWADLDSDTNRMLYETGIAHLDIEGRISGDPREFKAAVAPMLDHITKEKVLKFFNDAERVGLIIRYKVEKKFVVQYPGFKKNQTLRPDRESPSQYPEPPEHSWTTPGVIQEEDRTTPAEVKLKEVNLIEDNTPLPPKRGRGPVYSQEFETFYEAYPKKVAKPEAWKSWQKQKQSGILPENGKVIAAIEEQKKSDQWRKDGGQFIPNPATWLNQGRWDDKLQASGEARAW